MPMFNETAGFGLLIINFTNNITGDIFLTLLALLMIVLFFFFAMRIPVEFSVILILPILIVYMAFGGEDWLPVAGLTLLYLSLMFGRYFFR